MTRADRPSGELRIERAGRLDLAECLEIRHTVFVVEQGVPEMVEQDGLDDACLHLIARVGEHAVGTARLREVSLLAKAERVAVLPDMRGRGFGRALMDALEVMARERDHARVSLHAQSSAVAFYLELGYAPQGEPFDEAGIPHQAMSKPLDESKRRGQS